MSTRLKNIDRDTPMLMPVDMRDWIPEQHMVNFIIDAISTLCLRGFRVNERGSGSEQYPPSMMAALLIYCYATGRMSSREIEAATYSDVAVRYICGGSHHPDHDTICTFRRENRALFSECFVKVLALARELGQLKRIGGIAVDGTKVKANASKHAAVSYKRAGQMIEQLELEVEELMKKAEDADSTPLQDGLSLPEEITRRTDRKAKLEAARQAIEARFEARREEKMAEYHAKLQEREHRRQKGESIRGPKLKTPPDTPEDKSQVNFTDPDSRIMKGGSRSHHEQAYNAQAAVDIEGSYLILGQRVSDNPNDKQELVADVSCVPETIRQVDAVLADSGYFSEKAVEEVEANDGPTAYVATQKTTHHVSISDLEKKPDPPSPDKEASTIDIMRHRLETESGRKTYALRKQTVEPVFGIIKQVIGFRQFHLRGHPKVETEWTLVTLAYNMKRLYNMVGNCTMPEKRSILTSCG